jgi:hypothetical protein
MPKSSDHKLVTYISLVIDKRTRPSDKLSMPMQSLADALENDWTHSITASDASKVISRIRNAKIHHNS